MKLQIAYELTDLHTALEIAKQTYKFADILEVGTLLIYKEGIKSIELFRREFPRKEILADAKISDRAIDAVTLFAQAGANIITILAGTDNKTIHKATQTAHSLNVKIALDLMDASSMGQSAMDAEKLGIDYIIFHRSHDVDPDTIIDLWDSTKGNTELPIFISGAIDASNINKILSLKPQGIVIDSAITKANDPAKEAEHIKSLLL